MGYVLAIIYILTISLSSVFLNKIGDSYNFWITLFVTQLTALVVFNIFNYKKIIANHLKILKFKQDWFLTNISVLLVTCFTYYSIINSSADFFIAVYCISTAMVSSYFGNDDYYKTLVCVLTLIICFVSDKSVTLLTFVCAILAGSSGYWYGALSNEFIKKADLNVSDLLSFRFHLITIISFFCMMNYVSFDNFNSFDISSLGVLIFLGLVNIVLPLYISQKSLFLLGVQKFSYILTFLPIVAYFIESFTKDSFPINFFIASLLSTLTLNYDLIKNIIKKYLA